MKSITFTKKIKRVIRGVYDVDVYSDWGCDDTSIEDPEELIKAHFDCEINMVIVDSEQNVIRIGEVTTIEDLD